MASRSDAVSRGMSQRSRGIGDERGSLNALDVAEDC
jgi:hypothetical protein